MERCCDLQSAIWLSSHLRKTDLAGYQTRRSCPVNAGGLWWTATQRAWQEDAMNEHPEVNTMEQIQIQTNGCNVTLNFPKVPKPDARMDLARALLDAVEEQLDKDAAQ